MMMTTGPQIADTHRSIHTDNRRHIRRLSSRRLLRILLTSLILITSGPATAEDLLDWVITAVDPTLAPARPLIECLAGGGSAATCASAAAQATTPGLIQIGPEDNRIRKIVSVFDAARREKWFEVITIGGEVVATSVSCSMLPIQGPAKQPACNIIGWVISNNIEVIDKAYGVLKGPDWWGVVELLGPGVCHFIPGDGAAGAAKDLVCGTFGEVLRTAHKVADTIAKGLVAGADAVENLFFGDDSHMPYDTYYALHWQPWYHLAVTQVLNGQSLSQLNSKIWHPCVDYFDSHNQYRSTARKTCDDMRDKRFNPEVLAFAKAMPVAVDGYYDTVARPAIRAAVLVSFGKPSSETLPGQKFFVQNCAFHMRKNFPYPEADDTQCQHLQTMVASLPGQFKSQMDSLVAKCFADAQMRDVQPTVWTRACEGMEQRYAQDFASESLRLIIQLSQLKQKGCLAPGKEIAAESGLKVTCDNYAGHATCLSIFKRDGKRYCHADVPPIRIDLPDIPPQAIPLPAKPPAITIPLPGKRSPGKQPQVIKPPVQKTSPPVTKPVIQDRLRIVRTAPVLIEAESLTQRSKSSVRGGRITPQAMAGFGKGWSGNKQLFWSGGKRQSTLDMKIQLPHAGKWRITIYLTRAPDYGQLKFSVNGKSAQAGFDGYAKWVNGPVKLDLGSFVMQQGDNSLRATISGRHRASAGFFAGIDRITLAAE